MNYILDTNILLSYIRADKLSHHLNTHFKPFGAGNIAIASIVSIAELKALGVRNNWGKNRFDAIERLRKQLVEIPIESEDLIDAYVEIDIFSQGKHPVKPLGTTARTMGKNDIWIAATAYLLKSTLLTTDRDFNHLDGSFINLAYFDITLI